MPNWKESMQQTFEYYTVDPGTWKDVARLTNVKSCSISIDSGATTMGSATIDVTESLGECYVRVYLITIQNGIKERFPLGTYLVQTPTSNFNGKVRSISMDAYTPLLELKENPPPLGYALLKGENIMSAAYRLVREHARAPVVATENSTTLDYDFVANTEDTWLTFVSDLIANANYSFSLDELSRILFAPNQDIASLQPVWTYDDSDKSIIYHDISMNHDLFDVPNVVEVVYSNGKDTLYARAVNDDPNSPTSIVSRGRELKRRITNPNVAGFTGQAHLDEYAKKTLKDLSSIEYKISYSHGYCPVRVGDCVRINYSRAGITDIKAKVISQSIKCEPGCPVSEVAVFTTNLWG